MSQKTLCVPITQTLPVGLTSRLLGRTQFSPVTRNRYTIAVSFRATTLPHDRTNDKKMSPIDVQDLLDCSFGHIVFLYITFEIAFLV